MPLHNLWRATGSARSTGRAELRQFERSLGRITDERRVARLEGTSGYPDPSGGRGPLCYPSGQV